VALPSGTYNFSPSLGSLGAYAFGRCGIRRPAITVDHLADLGMAANLVLAEWQNSTPNLWLMSLGSISLVQGTPTYTLPATVTLVTDCYITTNVGSPPPLDRVIFPVSRSTYASFPNKLEQSPPTTWWFDRVLPPQISVYPTADGNGPYTLNYWAVHQDQDAVVTGATGLDIPGRFLMAFVDAISVELAASYAPERAQTLYAKAQQSIETARAQDREDVTYFLTPGLSAYYRQR
jgi:hypothetical protein